MEYSDEDSSGSADDNMAACDQLHVKIHNFGIYKKNGKRAILQLDFPGESIYLIQRGHIKKTYSFEQLQHFDSEEGLQIVLKFRDNELEFDADNMEEKYTMCRLISLVLDKDEDEDVSPGLKDSGRRVSVLPQVPMQANKVIKEGVLEKKGNTTITTWNKRRLKVTPGEFSYYKPGEELALNIVQIWEDICVVKRSGQHGFTVTVRNRVYSFRLLHDQRANNPEVEREEWIEAFHKALKSKRNTFVMMEKTSALDTSRPSLTNFDFSDTALEQQPSIDEQIKMRKQSTQSIEDNVNDQTQVAKRKQEVTKHFSVHLSYVEKTTPLEQLPTARRPKPPAFTRQDAVARADLSSVSEDSQSDCKDNSRDNNNDGGVLTAREIWNKRDHKASKATTEVTSGHSDKSVEYVNVKKQKESTTMEVKIDFTEPEPEPDYPEVEYSHETCPVIETTVSSDTSSQSSLIRPSTFNTSQNSVLKPAPINISQKEMIKPAAINTSQNDVPKPSSPPPSSGTDIPKIPVSPTGNVTDDQKYSERSLPAPPPATAPPLTPPPPPLKATKSGVKLKVTPKVKLKQVHWSKVPQSAVSHTMWKNARDVTTCIDLKALEDLFALQEKDYVNIQSQAALLKKTKQILLDPKRAQNISIMFNGPKPDTVDRLTVALNSITEHEAFPVEKLNTLRRYQPTADDIEMYRMYRSTRQDQHPVDRFMIDLCDVPALGIRLDLVITILDFPNEFIELSEEVSELMLACEELTNNKPLASVMEYLLAIGNYMNAKWASGLGSHGFQITSVDKVLDIKSRDPQYTLVHFLVQQITRTNPMLVDWTSGVKHVQKCADLSIKAVGAEVEVLKNGLHKIKRNLKSLRNTLSSPNKQEKKFMSDVQNFITEYEKKLEKLNSRCSDLNKKYHAILDYFGECSTRTSDVLFSSISLFAERFQAAREKR